MITFKQMLSTRGRINRWTFFLSVFSLMSVCVILLTGAYLVRNSGMGVISKTVLALTFYAGIVFAYYIHIMMALKRLHAVNLSGWWSLSVAFVPVFPYSVAQSGLWQNDENGIWFLICMFFFIIQGLFILSLFLIPGREFYNHYGEKSRRQNLSKSSAEMERISF